MNKEEYLKQTNSLKDLIKQAQIDLRQTEQDYIQANKIFEIGDRIKIVKPRHKLTTIGGKNSGQETYREESFVYAYVGGYSINYCSDITYMLKAEKKDGTPSLLRQYYGSSDILIKAEINQ